MSHNFPCSPQGEIITVKPTCYIDKTILGWSELYQGASSFLVGIIEWQKGNSVYVSTIDMLQCTQIFKLISTFTVHYLTFLPLK